MRAGRSTRALGFLLGAVGLLASARARAQPPALGPAAEVDRPALVGAIGDQTSPAAAYLGEGLFAVAWRTSLWEGEVRAARVTADGQRREPRGVPLPGLAGNDARLALAAGGGSLIAVGTAGGQLQAVALAQGSTEAALRPAPPVRLASAPGEELGPPAVAWNGSGFWVAWSQGAAGIRGLRIDGQGQPLGAGPLSLAPGPGQTALGWDGTSTLAAWTTTADGHVVVRAARLDGAGNRIDPEALELGAVPGARAGRVAVASNGGLFLVAAAGEGGAGGGTALAAIRVSSEGRVLDAAPIALAQLQGPPEGGPTAVWNGSHFLILWGEPLSAGGVSPEGRLVDADGAVSAVGLPGLGAAGEQPAAVAGGGQTLAFLARAAGGRGDLDVRGLRLAGDGAAAGPDFLVSAGVNRQGKPALAAGGPAGDRRLLLAWEDGRADRLEGDVHAALLDGTGAPVEVESLPLAIGAASQRAPAVAWDGRAFQVIWHERGRGLHAARVGLDGSVLDRPALLVPGTAGRQALSDPALCGDDSGALLVWSARAAGSPPRAELRAVRIPPGGTVRDGEAVALLSTHDVSAPPVMRLACAAEGALLIWAGLYEMDRSDAPDLQMALLARRGEAGAPPVTLLERGAADEGPAVASDGRSFLVAWRPRQENSARVAIVGTRVGATGVGLDQPARELGSLNAGHAISAYWDGAQFVLAGMQALGLDDFQLRGRRLRADLGALDAGWFPIDKVSGRRGTGTLSTAAGLGGGEAVVVYETHAGDDATSNQRLHARLLRTPALDPGDAGAATPDIDAGADAGPLPARVGGGGCGCAVASSTPAPAALALATVLPALARRWRRAPARRPGQRPASEPSGS
jgi:hypothetical protein